MKQRILMGTVYGKLMILIGFLEMIPVIVLPFYEDESKYALSFLIPSFLSIILGMVLCCLIKQKEERKPEWNSPMQKGSIPVLFAWCYGILLGAMPFYLGGQLDFTFSLFESVSGWTTTGLSVVDVANTPQIFHFHRSFMQYCGGLGFILMMLILVQGKQAVDLYNAEGHSDRFMPNIKRTVQTIFGIYNIFLSIGVAAYTLFDMPLFDSVCHAMSALSTAGFSTEPGSIGDYGSFPIEIVSIILMLVGSTNFAVLLLLSKFKMKQVFRVSEVRFLGLLLLVTVPLTAFSLKREFGLGVPESFHEALFGVVSIFTTTGYSTVDYKLWPPFAVGILIVLMSVGGGMGSTAGGIKLSRIYLVIRIARENIRRRFSASRNITAPYYYRAQGKVPIDHKVAGDIFGFVSCYMGIIIIGTLLMTLLEGCSLGDALYEFSSVFGTVGVSNGLTHSVKNTATLWVEMFAMLLGRLEIFIVFIGIYTGFINIRKKWR